MDKDFYKDLEKIKTIGSTYMAAVGLAPTAGAKVGASSEPCSTPPSPRLPPPLPWGPRLSTLGLGLPSAQDQGRSLWAPSVSGSLQTRPPAGSRPRGHLLPQGGTEREVHRLSPSPTQKGRK